MPIEERYRNFGFAILEAIKERSEEFEYPDEEHENVYRWLLHRPTEFSICFLRRKNNPFYVSLYSGNRHLFELDLTLIVQNNNGLTWFLARPTEPINRNILDNLLPHNDAPSDYRDNVRNTKSYLNPRGTVWKQGYLMCENATWDELTDKIGNVIMAVAAAHGCDVGQIRNVEATVARSLRDLQFNRLQRIAVANKIPVSRLVQTTVFDRNQDIIDETLFRANGICERCNCKAPFCRASDNTPYLEVHHKKQLSHGGEDSLENAIALCPNCHREVHYGVGNV